MVSRRNEAVRRPKGSLNRNRAIAQQVGQRERRLARFLSSMSLAAAALPWTLADQPQNRKSTARSTRYRRPMLCSALARE